MQSTHRTLAIAAIVALSCAGAATAQDWPQWRGPQRDNHILGFQAPASWPKELARKWQVTVGIGEASPILVGDKLFVFGRQEGDEVVRCLDAADGAEKWKDKYETAAATGGPKGFPGPRSTPAAGDGKVCTLGLRGMLTCYDAASGKIVWRKNTKEFPQFFTSSSPIIADGMCIVFLEALTAFDLGTGDVKWKWNGGETPYGSPILATIDGVKQIVTPYDGGVAGVGLADGKLLWKHKVAGVGYTAHYSTPIIDGQTVIYSSAGGGKGGGGKGGGGTMTANKIEKKGDSFTTTEVWKKDFAAAGYHTPLLKDNLLYGVSSNGRNFFCLDVKTGDELWKDKTQRGQCGCILDAGPVLLALTSDKDLIAFKASNKEYAELATYRVASAETWCVPIVAGNRIFVKDKGGSLTLWTLD